MILPYELKELGFELFEKIDDAESWGYEAKIGIILVDFKDYQKTVILSIGDLDYKAEAELKGEVTIERIKNLIKALS
jgi:hypothetical protein